MEETLDLSSLDGAPPSPDPDHGWQKVTYNKRQRRHKPPPGPDQNGFDSLEQKAYERRSAMPDRGPLRSRRMMRTTTAA